MTPRRFLTTLLGALLVVLIFWQFRPRAPISAVGTSANAPHPPPTPLAPAAATSSTAATTAEDGGRSELADALNSPATDIHADLHVLDEVFMAYQTNFHGNPVGTNAEITAALTGKNPLHLALVPRDLPAINAHGELCDRWGSPFFFHQLSGTRMEIHSAGPDRKFWTDDDAVLTP